MACPSDDMEMLEINNRRLERENRLLRMTLWDEFFKAAISSGRPSADAAALADLALVVRNKRWGLE